MVYNHETWPGATGKSRKDLDVPPLNIILSNRILMFEETTPTVQRIKITDNTGFHPMLESVDGFLSSWQRSDGLLADHCCKV